MMKHELQHLGNVVTNFTIGSKLLKNVQLPCRLHSSIPGKSAVRDSICSKT